MPPREYTSRVHGQVQRKFRWPRRAPRSVQSATAPPPGPGGYETLVYVQHNSNPPVLNIRRYWNHPTMGRVPTPTGVSISLTDPSVLDDLIAALEELRPQQ